MKEIILIYLRWDIMEGPVINAPSFKYHVINLSTTSDT